MINTSPEEVFEIFKAKAVERSEQFSNYSKRVVETLEEFDEIGDMLINVYTPKLLVAESTNRVTGTVSWYEGKENGTLHRHKYFTRSTAYILNSYFEQANCVRIWSNESENRIEYVKRDMLFSCMKRFMMTGGINTEAAKAFIANESPSSHFVSATYFPETQSITYYEAEQFFTTNKRGNIYLKKRVTIKVTVNFSRAWTRITYGGRTRYLSLKNWGDYTGLFDEKIVFKFLTLGNTNLEFLKEIPVENISIPNSALRKSTSLKGLVKNHLGVSCDYLLKNFELSDVVKLYDFVKGDKSAMDTITTRIRAISETDMGVLNTAWKYRGNRACKVVFSMFLHGCEFFKDMALAAKANPSIDSDNFSPINKYRDEIYIIGDLVQMWPNGDGSVIPVKAKSYRRLKELHDQVSFFITVNRTEEFKVSRVFKKVFRNNTEFKYIPADNRTVLVKEGLEMKHCVATRRNNIASGRTCVYSILTPGYDPVTQAGRFTAEIGITTDIAGKDDFYIREIRGIRNCNPPHDVIEQVKADFLVPEVGRRKAADIYIAAEELAF